MNIILSIWFLVDKVHNCIRWPLSSAKFRTLILWVLIGLGVKVGYQGVVGLGWI